MPHGTWCRPCKAIHESIWDVAEHVRVSEATGHLTDADIAALSVWFGPQGEARNPRPVHWPPFSQMGSE